MRYGYKIFGLSITPVRQPGDPVTLDDSVFGPGGAREMIGRHLVASVEGKADEVRQLFTRVDVVQAEGWGLLLTVSGGPFGQSAEVVDLEQGRPRNPVVATDAVLSPGRVLFVVPPTGTHGVLVSEVRGRSHLTDGVLDRLNRKLKPSKLRVRVDGSVADDVAWNAYFDEEEVSVRRVELVQLDRRGDQDRLVSSDVIRKATVALDFRPDAPVKRQILDLLSGRRQRARATPLGRLGLAGLVGLRQYGDDAFDDETLVVVRDKRERRIHFTRGWPSFTYELPGEHLADPSFLDAVHDAVDDTLDALQVERPAGEWWPSGQRLRDLVRQAPAE